MRSISPLLLSLALFTSAYAQDMIYLKNGNVLSGRVTHIGHEVIRVKNEHGHAEEVATSTIHRFYDGKKRVNYFVRRIAHQYMPAHVEPSPDHHYVVQQLVEGRFSVYELLTHQLTPVHGTAGLADNAANHSSVHHYIEKGDSGLLPVNFHTHATKEQSAQTEIDITDFLSENEALVEAFNKEKRTIKVVIKYATRYNEWFMENMIREGKVIKEKIQHLLDNAGSSISNEERDCLNAFVSDNRLYYSINTGLDAEAIGLYVQAINVFASVRARTNFELKKRILEAQAAMICVDAE